MMRRKIARPNPRGVGLHEIGKELTTFSDAMPVSVTVHSTVANRSRRAWQWQLADIVTVLKNLSKAGLINLLGDSCTSRAALLDGCVCSLF
jgi:hypothetical protein